MDNCFAESFNGSFRDERQNVHWFEMIDEAKAKSEAWRIEYNESRPHEAFDELTPNEYALKCRVIETTESLQRRKFKPDSGLKFHSGSRCDCTQETNGPRNPGRSQLLLNGQPGCMLCIILERPDPLT